MISRRHDDHAMTPTAAEHRLRRSAVLAATVLGALWLAGCAGDSHTAQGAGRGAATGAVSGAVGGLVGSLVFGGNPAEAAARGAVYGGAVGATAGAIAGSEADRKIAEQEAQELAALRERIGDDAFSGLEALAECRHDVALAQGAKARQSENPNYALAGLWLEVLSHADRRDEERARALFPTVVETDWDVNSEAQAEETMRDALTKLMDIRETHRLPRVCPA
ncbi:MAG: hypothetical protein JSU82_06340 [Rhodospirillales bacterium]|nr:MAG: hypothetical protein JSU82_06340 [Rhodospirillales bacterium]